MEVLGGPLFGVAGAGESHGPAIVTTVFGCPPGLWVERAQIQHYLDRRRPGSNKLGTPRREDDQVTLLSGLYSEESRPTPIRPSAALAPRRGRDAGAHIPSWLYDGRADCRGRALGCQALGRLQAVRRAARPCPPWTYGPRQALQIAGFWGCARRRAFQLSLDHLRCHRRHHCPPLSGRALRHGHFLFDLPSRAAGDGRLPRGTSRRTGRRGRWAAPVSRNVCRA